MCLIPSPVLTCVLREQHDLCYCYKKDVLNKWTDGPFRLQPLLSLCCTMQDMSHKFHLDVGSILDFLKKEKRKKNIQPNFAEDYTVINLWVPKDETVCTRLYIL